MIDIAKLEALRAAAVGAQRLRVLAMRAGSTVTGLLEGASHEALAVIGKAGQESPTIPPVPFVNVPSDPATRVDLLAAIEAEADAVRISAARGGSDLCAFLIGTATDHAREHRYSLEAGMSKVVPFRPCALVHGMGTARHEHTGPSSA